MALVIPIKRMGVAALPLLAGLLAAPMAFAQSETSMKPNPVAPPTTLVIPAQSTVQMVQTQPTQVQVIQTQPAIVSPPLVLAQTQVMVAPVAPPPPQFETVPAPPSTATPVFWRPGHWKWAGSEWAWEPGQYISPPAAQVVGVFVPGHWSPEASGGYTWIEGYWK